MLLLLLCCLGVTVHMLRQQHDLANSSAMELPSRHHVQQRKCFVEPA
jgi:hypothetical protein